MHCKKECVQMSRKKLVYYNVRKPHSSCAILTRDIEKFRENYIAFHDNDIVIRRTTTQLYVWFWSWSSQTQLSAN